MALMSAFLRHKIGPKRLFATRAYRRSNTHKASPSFNKIPLHPPSSPFSKEGISISPPFIKGRRGGIGFEITFLFMEGL